MSVFVIGRVIDKYEILEEVGQGGMAVVYRGLDMSLQRQVAIKILHKHLAAVREARERLEREARAVAKLHHRNILEIFDYSGKDSPESYIVTEFIQGQTLREFVAEHAILHPEVAMLIVSEVCAALAHAHSLGVLHRDVKPENIMIRDDGVLKLTDFGIAHIVDAQRLTVTGTLLGSPAYMSPEHVEGGRLDFRTDVFSLGILLYQLATSELPFTGKTPHEILKKIGECKYVEPRALNPHVSDALARIIARALARRPDDRYPDVQPLGAEVAALLTEAGLADSHAEAQRFFLHPTLYQEELAGRLVTALGQAGHQALADGRTNPALELFNRVLTLEPHNTHVLRALDKLARRRRGRWLIGAALALAFFGVGAYGLVAWVKALPRQDVFDAGANATVVEGKSGVRLASAPDASPRSIALAHPTDAASPGPGASTKGTAAHNARDLPRPPAPRRVRLAVQPKSAQCQIDRGPFGPLDRGALYVDVRERPVTVKCHHPNGYTEEDSLTLPVAAGHDPTEFSLAWRPTGVIPVCPQATQGISVDGGSTRSGVVVDVTRFDGGGKKQVLVQFVLDGKLVEKTVDVVAGQAPQKVLCDAP